MALIDDVIETALRQATPSRGDDLLGFLIDLDHAFGEEVLFASFTIEQTNDPACMIRVRAVAHPGVPNLHSLTSALTKAWSWLCYPAFQASVLRRDRDAAVLRFVTATEGGGLCVTGELIATAPDYARLIAESERDFGIH